jgi:hypothetical protein
MFYACKGARTIFNGQRERERERERERGGEIEKEGGRQKERVFIIKRNDGCLGTF